MLPKRKSVHLKEFDYSTKTFPYYLTICCQDRREFLVSKELADLVVDTLSFMEDAGKSIISCYCIMPDHLHVVLELGDNFDKDLSSWVTSFKRFTGGVAKKNFGIVQLWQKNYYEHIVQSDESLTEICRYILENPVRKGLVKDWKDYPYSKVDEKWL